MAITRVIVPILLMVPFTVILALVYLTTDPLPRLLLNEMILSVLTLSPGRVFLSVWVPLTLGVAHLKH